MKKKILLIIPIIIIGYSIYYYQSTKVLRNIESQIKESNKIDFTKINFFNWDQLIILGPYSTIKSTEIKYKINLTDADNSIEMFDNINSIIFLKNKRLVEQVNLSRGLGEFTFNKNPIERDSAIFVYRKVKLNHYKNIYLKKFIQQVQPQ